RHLDAISSSARPIASLIPPLTVEVIAVLSFTASGPELLQKLLVDHRTPVFFLFNHLIGPGEHRRRDRQAESLGSLDLNYQLELRRLLNRQIGWFLALQ